MKIEIIRGAEMPSKRRTSAKYPFSEMNVTDSFQIPYDRLIHQSIYSCIKNFRLKNPTWKFRIFTNKDENWIKVFRVK